MRNLSLTISTKATMANNQNCHMAAGQAGVAPVQPMAVPPNSESEENMNIPDTLTLSCNENVIEFLRSEKTATLTFSQGRYIFKVKKLAEKRPDECQITKENKDGSIVAHVPVSWIKISPPKEMNFTEEQLKERTERLAVSRLK